jgi:uncharacterized protein (DUF4415 family)
MEAPVTRKRKALPITDEEEAEIQREIADDPDAPEITDEEIAAGGKPFKEVFPEIWAKMKQQAARGRPKLERPKEKVTIRLSAEVMEYYRGSGPGWQTRINNDLQGLLNKRRGMLAVDRMGIKKPRQSKVA